MHVFLHVVLKKKEQPKSVLCHWYDLPKIQYYNQYIDKYIRIYILLKNFQLIKFSTLIVCVVLISCILKSYKYHVKIFGLFSTCPKSLD